MPLRPANQPATETDVYCVVLSFLAQKSARNCYNNLRADRVRELGGEEAARAKIAANYGATRVAAADLVYAMATMDGVEGGENPSTGEPLVTADEASADRRVKVAVVDTMAEKLGVGAAPAAPSRWRVLYTVRNKEGFVDQDSDVVSAGSAAEAKRIVAIEHLGDSSFKAIYDVVPEEP